MCLNIRLQIVLKNFGVWAGFRRKSEYGIPETENNNNWTIPETWNFVYEYLKKKLKPES